MYNGECNHSFFDWYLSNFPFKFLFPSFPPKWLPPNGLNSSKSKSDWLGWMEPEQLKKTIPKKKTTKTGNVCLGDPPRSGSIPVVHPPFPPLREDPELGPGEISTNLFFIQVLHPGEGFSAPPKKWKKWGISPTDGRMDGFIWVFPPKIGGNFPQNGWWK